MTAAVRERICTGGQKQGERRAEGAVGNGGEGSLGVEILNIETWGSEDHMERIANVCREGGFSMGGHLGLTLDGQGQRFAFVQLLKGAEIGA